MQTFYVLRTRKKAVRLRIDVNDCPAVVSLGPDEADEMAQVNQWLRPGENTLRARIDWPPDVPYQQGAASLRAELVAGQPGEKTPRRMALLTWPPDEEGAGEGYPAERSETFQPLEPPAGELWSRAEPVDLDERASAAALEPVRALHAALDARDAARAMDLLAFKATDVGATHYFPPEESLKRQRKFLDFVFGNPSLKLRAFDPGELTVHPVGGGRLGWVTRTDYAPALVSEDDGEPGLILPVFVARIDGEWTVAR